MLSLRSLLVLGRTSNLPTVWSNCFAGWLLGGAAGKPYKFTLLLLGTTLCYLGGMFLNDAFDARFDAQYRRDRPIPSCAVSAGTVFWIGFTFLAAGWVALSFIGTVASILAGMLVILVILYNAVHKVFTLSPFLMAGCRFLVYAVAGYAGGEGLSGWPLWCGVALAGYIVGLSFLARKESTGVALNYWPCVMLAAPIGVAWIMNVGAYRANAILLSVLLLLWIAKSLRHAISTTDRNVGRAVSGLLSGIVLVDLLAVADVSRGQAGAFIAMLILSIYMQRLVPAT